MGEREWPYTTPGVPDAWLAHEGVPMTRQEVRAVVLAQARLRPGLTVVDVGAGAGSLTVEAALAVRPAPVYAVERQPRARDLLRQNLVAFGLDNVRLLPGEAPEALEGLSGVHRVLVGGSGGRLAEILTWLERGLVPGGRVVVTAVSLPSLYGAWETLDRLGYQPQVSCLTVARLRPLGETYIFQGANPVYVIWGSRPLQA